MWPHSPAIAFGPVSTFRSTTTPPPVPVPTITPKTTRAPAAAPSTASERAKQFASFAKRTGRPRSPERSRSRGCPISQVEFAFLTRPLAGERAPGIPTPTVAAASGVRLEVAHETGHRLERRPVVVPGRRHPAPGELRPVVRERHALDLRAPEVEPDAHARGFSSFREVGFKASLVCFPE